MFNLSSAHAPQFLLDRFPTCMQSLLLMSFLLCWLIRPRWLLNKENWKKLGECCRGQFCSSNSEKLSWFSQERFFRFLFLKRTGSMFVLKSRILVAACWASSLDQYPCLILVESSFDFSEDNIYSMLLSRLVLGFCACPQACQRRNWKLRQEHFHDRSEVPSSSARQDKWYNAANPSQGWPSGTERLTYSTKNLVLRGLDQKYFTTFPCVIYSPLVHPAKDNMEMRLPACMEVFCSLPDALKVSRALSAL